MCLKNVCLYIVLVVGVYGMGVVKLSQSGKALLFVSDEGVVYSLARSSVEGLLRGEKRFGSLVLTRLPFSVSPDRFPKSPVYEPKSTEADKYGHVDPMTPESHKVKSEMVSSTDFVLDEFNYGGD
jgi:hypothetical protein